MKDILNFPFNNKVNNQMNEKSLDVQIRLIAVKKQQSLIIEYITFSLFNLQYRQKSYQISYLMLTLYYNIEWNRIYIYLKTCVISLMYLDNLDLILY